MVQGRQPYLVPFPDPLTLTRRKVEVGLLPTFRRVSVRGSGNETSLTYLLTALGNRSQTFSRGGAYGVN